MKKIFSILFVACGLSLVAQNAPKYEMRAGWVASVGNLDWPSKPGLSVEQQKAEYLQYLDTLVAINSNAVVMHIRPTADSYYPEGKEPWSKFLTGTQGQAPEPLYDPLSFMIHETHKRGMEFHAWLNPYRVSMSGDSTQFAKSHLYWQHRDWFVWYGGKCYFDPGIPECRKFANEMLADMVRRYDLDAIHFDDYFYPYQVDKKDTTIVKGKNGKDSIVTKTVIVDFPDEVSWQKYGKRFFSERDDWRRQNVNLLIGELSQTIRNNKPWVKFGISPFCVWRNQSVDPTGSKTFVKQSNYDQLYADILLWMKKGWIDYVTPQLYYPRSNKNANYDELLSWWTKLTDSKKFHLYVGLSMWNETDELLYEIDQIRSFLPSQKTSGEFFWSARVFMQNKNGLNQVLKAGVYKHPAIVPPMPWHDMSPAPEAQKLKAENKANAVKLSWDTKYSDNLMYYIVYRFKSSEQKDLNNPANIVSKIYYDNDTQKTFWDEKLPKGEYTYCVTSLTRNNVESNKAEVSVKIK